MTSTTQRLTLLKLKISPLAVVVQSRISMHQPRYTTKFSTIGTSFVTKNVRFVTLSSSTLNTQLVMGPSATSAGDTVGIYHPSFIFICFLFLELFGRLPLAHTESANAGAVF